MSVSRLTVWLHKGPSIFNLWLLVFLNWYSMVMDRDSWFLTTRVPGLTIPIVTKSLENKRLTLTANISLLYGNYSSNIPPHGLLPSLQQHSCKPKEKNLVSSLLIFKQLPYVQKCTKLRFTPFMIDIKTCSQALTLTLAQAIKVTNRCV